MKYIRSVIIMILVAAIVLSISPAIAFAHDQTAIPKSVKATVSTDINNKHIKLTWKAADRAKGYDIFRTTGSTFSDKPYATVKGSTSFVDKDIKADKTYKYKIRAFHMHVLVPKRSGFSSIVEAKWTSATKLSIPLIEIKLANKSKYKMTASISPQDASDKTIKWYSSKSGIVSVNKSTGELSTLKPGDSVITAQSNSGKLIAKCTVHVVDIKKVMDEVSLTQSVSGPCVLYSITMMLRRQEIYSKYPFVSEPTITFNKVKEWNGNVNSAKWYNTKKNSKNWNNLKGSLDKTIKKNTGFDTGAQNHAALGSDGNAKKNSVIELLKNNPEGIVAYFTSSTKQHAVLITDYIDGVFYVCDPASKTGREALENSSLVTSMFKTGKNYNKLFGYLNCIYYSIN